MSVNDFDKYTKREKTNIVIFKRSRQEDNFKFFYYGEEKITVIKTYKYLGVNFASSCVFP